MELHKWHSIILLFLLCIGITSCSNQIPIVPTAYSIPTVSPTWENIVQDAVDPCIDITKSNGSIAVGKISLTIQSNDHIYFFNSDLSGCYRIASHGQDIYLNQNDCSLTGISGDLLEPILKVNNRDFYDNLLSEAVYHFPDPADSELIYSFTPSPDDQWIAYKQVTGEYFRSLVEANQTEVKLVHLLDSQTMEVISLTDHSAAHHSNLAWSPDGRYLAYPDFDINGVTQINIYEPLTGRKTQLSNFTDGKGEYGITHLAWSGDSAELLFVKVKYRPDGPYLYDYSGGGLGAIDLADGYVRWIIPFSEDIGIQSINVNNKGEVLTLLRNYKQTRKFAITVFDIKSGSEINTISPSILTKINDVAFIIPLDPDFNRLVIDFGPTFVYDKKNNSQDVITSYPFFFNFRVITTPAGTITPPICEPGR
jgi:WD40 repeat protein